MFEDQLDQLTREHDIAMALKQKRLNWRGEVVDVTLMFIFVFMVIKVLMKVIEFAAY
jgi:hypothetical protein